MAEEFRDGFLGDAGFDILKKLMKGNNDFTFDVAKVLQERSDAEMLYARALRKNGESLEKLASRTVGSVKLALTTLATQAGKESDARTIIADVLIKDISIPMKNRADKQLKEKKTIEDTLNAKFKEWNTKKETDNKYRSRQFEKSQEIESLYNKLSELPKGTKNFAKDSTKENIFSTPLLMGCVKPGGTTATSDVKSQTNISTSIQKATEELERTEIKYHTSTRDVELARQACDAEMCRGCDQMQKMELERITEMANFIQIYANSIQSFSDTMYQVSRDLLSIQIYPEDDIITEVRTYSKKKAETEILLYDIYAETNPMNDERRISSFERWIDLLKNDIKVQKQPNNAGISALIKASTNKIDEDELDISSDGAMCSTPSHSKTGTIYVVFTLPINVNSDHRHSRDGSSSSSNDDDGAMRRSKHKNRDEKKTEGAEKVVSEVFLDRRGARFLQILYEASLYKIETAYSQFKNLTEPSYEYSNYITRTSNDKGTPTTFIRIPFQPSTYTPPSAPPATKYFAEAMPMFTEQMSQLRLHSVQTHEPPPPPPIGFRQPRMEHTGPDNEPEASAPLYPDIMTTSSEPPQQYQHQHRHQHKHEHQLVRALHPYKARESDELSFEKGDIILLLCTRRDGWCKGRIEGITGLFPANHVENM
ncbi:unnamed protein product [Adineta steineri]|uniref:SH3 domain-containing protein n=1 Tax=Adineta steineri TaxID=433720 RepID=A0A819FS84_9BILA|nr:unnamed protein product [Adineta steineri]